MSDTTYQPTIVLLHLLLKHVAEPIGIILIQSPDQHATITLETVAAIQFHIGGASLLIGKQWLIHL